MTHYISPERLTIEHVGTILREKATLILSEESKRRIERCRKYLDDKISTCREPVYGINTGFGSLCNISINSDDLAQLQKNLVMSHACGLGERVPAPVVRLMLLLKIQSLSYGNSGVQLATVQRLVDFFNADILPVVYTQGSLGASGDLAPLANLSLPILGLGEVEYEGKVRPAAEVLAEKGMEPLSLMSKEGLALLNGTQFMSSYGVWCLLQARRLAEQADEIAAMSLDAFDGRIEPKQNWNYIRGILRNLAKQKVRSVADWDRLEAERERRKNGANRKGPGPDHGQNTGPPGAEGAGAGIGGFHPAESADE